MNFIYLMICLYFRDEMGQKYDGRGISEKDYPHIFERFYKTSVDNPKGTGLGLAIAQEIVNGLDETIWVQSKEGEGTIFFVTVATAT